MTDTTTSRGQQQRRQRDSAPPAPNDWKVAIEISPDPDLLYVKLRSQRPAGADLADLPAQIQELLDRRLDDHLDHRIVLALDEILVLDARLIHALVELHRQIHAGEESCGLADWIQDTNEP